MIRISKQCIQYQRHTKWSELNISKYSSTDLPAFADLTQLFQIDFTENQKNIPAVLNSATPLEKDVIKKLLIDDATELIENGKLDKTIKLLKIYFKEENNKELLFKIILLSQQLNSAKEHFELGMLSNHDQKMELARITKALLTLIWEAEAQ
jgi:hypothetical protein